MTSQPESAKSLIKSCVIRGADALGVDVEASLSAAWETPDASPTAGKESVIRIRSALQSLGVEPRTMRLSARPPVPSTGGMLDLPMAMAVLVAMGEVLPATLDGILVLGELGLDGSLRATRGVLSAALLARASGMRGVLVPAACAWEAKMVDRIEVLAADDLAGVLAVLRGERTEIEIAAEGVGAGQGIPALDMADEELRGQESAIAAIAELVALGVGMLLEGPPGTGKTMLARRVGTLLPEMTAGESIAVTRIYSAVGMAHGPVRQRPFRAPHHTISAAGLSGGAGTARRPGELQLATRGVLYLDELPEFKLSTIATLAASIREMALPDRPVIVASASPCSCGWFGSEAKACTCPPEAVERYRAYTRMLAAELDVERVVEVSVVSRATRRDAAPGESSASIRGRLWSNTPENRRAARVALAGQE